MNMISRLITGLALIAACLSTNLWASDVNEERARTATDAMVDQLQLSDAQAEKVYVLNKQLFSDLSDMRDQSSSNRMAQLRALRALGKERDAAMQEVLDEEQYKTWSANAKERREKMRQYLKDQRSAKTN